MPLYIGDYLADTMHLSGTEHGAYLLLIMHYWRNGALPDDDKTLAAIARTDRKEWVNTIGPIVREFFRAEDGRLHHKRIDHELATADAHIEQRKAAGKASAAKRALQREANGAGNDNTNELPTVVEISCQRNAIPSPSPSPEDLPSLRSGPPDGPLGIRDALWRDGIPILRSLLGKSDKQSRAFLGGLLKGSHDDCSRIYNALREAESLRPIDPAAWLTRACAVNGRAGPPAKMAHLAAAYGIGPPQQAPAFDLDLQAEPAP